MEAFSTSAATSVYGKLIKIDGSIKVNAEVTLHSGQLRWLEVIR